MEIMLSATLKVGHVLIEKILSMKVSLKLVQPNQIHSIKSTTPDTCPFCGPREKDHSLVIRDFINSLSIILPSAPEKTNNQAIGCPKT